MTRNLDELVQRLDDIARLLAALNAEPVPAVDLAAQELRNIVNAKRFDRESFTSDTEFADWVQSRARHILASVPAVDLAEFKREAMRLADELAEAKVEKASMRTHYPTALNDYVEARVALQSHLDKLGGK